MTTETKREFGMPFRTLPLWLRQYWWQWTYYGKHPASDYLMWMIESINPEAAEYLAQGDAERIKQNGALRPKTTCQRASYEIATAKWGPKMQEQSDFEFADAIALRIGTLINDTPNRSREAVLIAPMMAISDVIGSIGCRDCRAWAVKSVKKALPKFINCALEQAIDRPSDHVH
jgi:hypothetical protein